MTDADVVDLAARPYVCVRDLVRMSEIPRVAHRLADVFAHLAARGTPPAGAPFLKYDQFALGTDHADLTVVVEAGVPVPTPTATDGEFIGAELPGGRFLRAVHHGPPDGLHDATAELLDTAHRQNLLLDRVEREGVEFWGARLEVYLSDPAQVAPRDWDTELLFRLAD
jgi:effector-binding domain-containing protein